MDEWFGLTLEQVKKYEMEVQERQNQMGFATGGLPENAASHAGDRPIEELHESEQYHTPVASRKASSGGLRVPTPPVSGEL